MENKWSKWRPFPDPRKKEYLNAPFGLGVYELRRIDTKEYILFGKGRNTAYRMTSLLPSLYGQGSRKNNDKREYILDNIGNIEYRTMAFSNKDDMNKFETSLKSQNKYIYNT